MFRYQIKTSEAVKRKIAAAGGEDSIAQRYLYGIWWRLAREPYPEESCVIDEGRNIRAIKNDKKLPHDPTILVTYQIIDNDEYYDMEIKDIEITP